MPVVNGAYNQTNLQLRVPRCMCVFIYIYYIHSNPKKDSTVQWHPTKIVQISLSTFWGVLVSQYRNINRRWVNMGGVCLRRWIPAMQMSIPIAMLTADSLGPPSLPNCDHVPVNLLVLSKKRMGMGEWDDSCYCGSFPKIPENSLRAAQVSKMIWPPN